MTFEVLRPLKLKSRGGQVVYPGDRIDADPEKAKPLIERGFLRPVESTEVSIQVDEVIEWDSPLFGLLAGHVTAILPDNMVEVDHPLTKEGAVIPREWIKGVFGGEVDQGSVGKPGQS